jgi:hypothetical protein
MILKKKKKKPFVGPVPKLPTLRRLRHKGSKFETRWAS